MAQDANNVLCGQNSENWSDWTHLGRQSVRAARRDPSNEWTEGKTSLLVLQL